MEPPTPSSTPSTEPSPDFPPGPDVDHPTDEPDLPTDEPTTTTIPEPTPGLGTPPVVDTLPVTGAGTTLAWIAGGLLALGGVLVALVRRRNASPPGPDDSPEAEAAAIRAARRGFTHPADTD